MPSNPHEGWNNAPYLPGISREPGGQLIGTPKKENTLKQEDDFSFSDILDAVNPLHHLPVISTMYRNVTGDGLSSLAKLAGSALFFGPLGLKIAAADVAVQAITGSSVEQHILSLFDNDNGQGGDVAPTEQQAADTTPENSAFQTASKARSQGTQENFVLSHSDATMNGNMSLAQQSYQRTRRSSLSHPVSAPRADDSPWTPELSDARFRTQAPPSGGPTPRTGTSTLVSKTPPSQTRPQDSDTTASSPSPYVTAKTLEELVERYAVSEARTKTSQEAPSSLPQPARTQNAAHNEHHLSLHLKTIRQAAARYQQATHHNVPKAGYNL